MMGGPLEAGERIAERLRTERPLLTPTLLRLVRLANAMSEK
jgi:hypothetical protein